MSFATYGEIRAKVEVDLDMEDETFVKPDEMLGYCKDAIHEAEVIINSLCADYFLAEPYVLNLVAGQSEYDLPTDIFADKVRRIVYYDGSELYNIKRQRRTNSFRDIEDIQTNETFTYQILNGSTPGRKIHFYPTPQANETATVKIWYIRNANLPSTDTDIIDINEFRSFIEKAMKMYCMAKEGHPNLDMAVREYEAEKEAMDKTLRDRIPDEDTQVEQDHTFYREMS